MTEHLDVAETRCDPERWLARMHTASATSRSTPVRGRGRRALCKAVEEDDIALDRSDVAVRLQAVVYSI